MVPRSSDEMRVKFPATDSFAAVARVTATGLALRLGYDVAQVESLRLGVEQAAAALTGPGSISLVGRWHDEGLEFVLCNADSGVQSGPLQDLQAEHSKVVTRVSIDEQSVTLTVGQF